MRVIVDFNSDGSKVSGELMFTGPCARMEGNRVLDSLKKLKVEKGFNGCVSEADIGYKKNAHIIQNEDVLSFSGTDSVAIAEKILEENKKRFPDRKINIKVFHEDTSVVTVLVSEEEIPEQIEKDYQQRTLLLNEKEIKIDESLFELIKLLNEKGYTTLYCCSGHKTVHDGNIEIQDGKGYSCEKFSELFPDREHGEKTIILRSCKPLISSGYIMFEYNDKNLDLFNRLEKDCPVCKNGGEVFGVDSYQNVNFPFLDDRESFSDEEVFYTEYPETIKGKRLILRWNQSSIYEKLLKKVEEGVKKIIEG